MQNSENTVKYLKALELYEQPESQQQAITLFREILDTSGNIKNHLIEGCNFFLGIFHWSKDSEQAFEYLNKIQRKYSQRFFSLASLALYDLTNEVKFLNRIRISDDYENYSIAQFKKGKREISITKKNVHWQKISKKSKVYIKNRAEIYNVNKMVKLKNKNKQKQIGGVFEEVGTILKLLFIEYNEEKYIAHYTNLSVSKILLSKQDQQPFQRLRLNTVNLMNDPEEGLLIDYLLSLHFSTSNQLNAFIACFTLHHDSLNQFRLYSKEGKDEALGVSLILDRNFFSSEHNVASISEKDELENDLQEIKINEITEKIILNF